MQGPRVAIVQLVKPDGQISVLASQNVFEFACELMQEGCQVGLTASEKVDEQLFIDLQRSDRVLLWDPDVLVDIPATRFALGQGVKLLDVLDAADVVTAPVLRTEDSLVVFDRPETYDVSRGRGNLGSALLEPLQRERRPIPFSACGCYWMWIHTTAHARRLRIENPVCVGGLDVTLSRMLIEGGCTAMIEPRLAVTACLRVQAPWALGPAEVAPLPGEPTP